MIHDHLVEQLRAGDERAFQTIFDISYPPLYVFCKSFIKDTSLAEEIISDVLLKVWQRRERFEDGQKLKAFLFISVKNESLNTIKKNKRLASLAEEFQFLTQQNDEVYYDKLLNESMIKGDALNIMLDMSINDLPAQAKRIIQLSYIDNRDNFQIAKEMSLSIQTVKNQKVRGIKMLYIKLCGLAQSSIFKGLLPKNHADRKPI